MQRVVSTLPEGLYDEATNVTQALNRMYQDQDLRPHLDQLLEHVTDEMVYHDDEMSGESSRNDLEPGFFENLPTPFRDWDAVRTHMEFTGMLDQHPFLMYNLAIFFRAPGLTEYEHQKVRGQGVVDFKRNNTYMMSLLIHGEDGIPELDTRTAAMVPIMVGHGHGLGLYKDPVEEITFIDSAFELELHQTMLALSENGVIRVEGQDYEVDSVLPFIDEFKRDSELIADYLYAVGFRVTAKDILYLMRNLRVNQQAVFSIYRRMQVTPTRREAREIVALARSMLSSSRNTEGLTEALNTLISVCGTVL